MDRLNPCVTGDTKVWTVDGLKTFKELADNDKDIMVYCLDVDGSIKMSKMFHPRITGYKMKVLKIILDDDTVLKVTPEHLLLTKDGYQYAEDLFVDSEIMFVGDGEELPIDIDEYIDQYVEYVGTKKGSVIKKCEVTGDEFECRWDERELCAKPGHESELYNISIERIKTSIFDSLGKYDFKKVKSIEMMNELEDVYNGTVAVYHNYFTVDDNTNTIVNQLNCGE